eukprot:2562530-Prymnesium_polylepis.2
MGDRTTRVGVVDSVGTNPRAGQAPACSDSVHGHLALLRDANRKKCVGHCDSDWGSHDRPHVAHLPQTPPTHSPLPERHWAAHSPTEPLGAAHSPRDQKRSAPLRTVRCVSGVLCHGSRVCPRPFRARGPRGRLGTRRKPTRYASTLARSRDTPSKGASK